MNKSERFIRIGSQFLDLSARILKTLWENASLIIGYVILISSLSWVWLEDFDKTSETIALSSISSNMGEVIIIDPLVQSLQDKVDFVTEDETQFSKIPFTRTFLGTIDAVNMKIGVISVTKEGIYYLYVQRLNISSLRNALLQQIETVQIKDGLAEISLDRDWKTSMIISVLTILISFCIFTRIWDS